MNADTGLRRSAWLLVIASLGLAGSQVSSSRARPNDDGVSYYALLEDWPVPSSTVTWPSGARSLASHAEGRTLLVPGFEPARIAVLHPDGGQLGEFGQGVLGDPYDVSVVYPPDEIGGGLDPAAARFVVTDRGRSQVFLFDADGTLLKTVSGLGTPRGVVGTAGHAFVADGSGRRIIRVTYDGSAVPFYGDGVPADKRLLDPDQLALVGKRLVVADRGRNALVWLAEDGTWLADMPLEWAGASQTPLDVTAVAGAGAAWLVVRTPTGLLALESASLEPLDAGAFETRLLPPTVDGVLGIALAPLVPHERGGIFAAPTLYVLGRTGHVGRWAINGWYLHRRRHSENALVPLCPMIDERPNRPWRIGVDAEGRVLVANTHGVLTAIRGPVTTRIAEFGDIDDFVPTGEGTFLLSSRGMPVQLTRQGAGMWRVVGPRESQRAAGWWYNEWDCTPAGLPSQPSLDASADGSVLDHVVVGWLNMGVTGDWSATGRHYRAVRKAGSPGFSEWEPMVFGVPFDTDPTVARLITDVVALANGVSLVVDRRAGEVERVRFSGRSVQSLGKVSIPGQPVRAARGIGDTTFVLTAEGYVWHLSASGEVAEGWDARAMLSGRPSEFIDIAADPTGRVYILDAAGERVLVFGPVPGGGPMATPVLPPPCTVRPDKYAVPPRVPIGAAVTVTLALGGDCGQTSATTDILLVLDPADTSWAKEAARRASLDFLVNVDREQDRVGLMVFDQRAEIVRPFSHDTEALTQAVLSLEPISQTSRADLVQPLAVADDYIRRSRRPEAQAVVVVAAPATHYLWPESEDYLLAADRLRDAGVRVISISDAESYLAATIAYRPEDFYIAPDRDTLAAVYRQLGRAFSARVLGRALEVRDVVPTNMRLVTETLTSGAVWDEATRTLSWQVDEVGFGGWRASYGLVPTAEGRWPTNERALAQYIDGFGHAGQASFPQPWIEVVPAPTVTPTPTDTPPPRTTTASRTPSSTVTPRPQPVYLPLSLREEPCTREQRADVVLVMDASSSMGETSGDGRTKLAASQAAAAAFLGRLKLNEGDQAAVVAFNRDARLAVGLTSDRAALTSALGLITTGSQTCLVCGLEAAAVELASARHRAENQAVVILLTDGRSNPRPASEAVVVAGRLKERGAVVFTIGLGAELDDAALTAIASKPAFAHRAADGTALEAIYRQIAGTLPGPADCYWGRR